MPLSKVSKKIWKNLQYAGLWCLLILAFAINGCESEALPEPIPEDPNQLLDFPSFVTPVEDYFRLSIGKVPVIDSTSYQLTISGAIDHPVTFSLEELRNLELFERTLTIECIENPSNGKLLGNATWKGFKLYDLLKSRGIHEGTIAVKYICADGYYTYNTLAELQEADVLAALYMNNSPIPAKYGFPLRIVFPGYYGVRQPGWVVEIEVLEDEVEDYWARTGWKTDTSMAIDSKIFFPPKRTSFSVGDSVRIGGAAYGSRRISSVDISVDDGQTWIPATIREEIDEDYAWVFWEVILIPQSTGSLTIQSRATGEDGSIQPRTDNVYLDGTNSWPTLSISIK